MAASVRLFFALDGGDGRVHVRWRLWRSRRRNRRRRKTFASRLDVPAVITDGAGLFATRAGRRRCGTCHRHASRRGIFARRCCCTWSWRRAAARCMLAVSRAGVLSARPSRGEVVSGSACRSRCCSLMLVQLALRGGHLGRQVWLARLGCRFRWASGRRDLRRHRRKLMQAQLLVTTAHVATGSLILATSLVVTLLLVGGIVVRRVLACGSIGGRAPS